MVIEIKIKANGETIQDYVKKKDTTLIENAIVLRKLEEIKIELLDQEYNSSLEVEGEED